MSPRWGKFAEQEQAETGDDRETVMRRIVCDYVSGMTDRFAQEQYLRLFEPFEKM